ncbi:MAG: peptidylprolyl isomerase [Rhodobacteraceae bacterium]|nr:peptidylprolyl isomerase [Paracoccaceae bacterium]
MTVRINDVAVDPGEGDSDELAASRELLRQRARELDMLEPGADDDEAIERLLAREIDVPEPREAECRRYYEAHPDDYHSGDLVHVRHILFQVTPGVPAMKLSHYAEGVLKELRAKPRMFGEVAQQSSNCPSGAQGGNLGQIARGATVPEFEKAVFDTPNRGILPRLVRTRFGFHIVAVDKRIRGERLPFEAVAGRIAETLRERAEARAIRQYVAILAGRAKIEGVALDASPSPLVQ